MDFSLPHFVTLEDYRHEKVPIPEPGYNEILVKVKAVGICASDGKVYIGSEKYWGKPGQTPQLNSTKLPVIPGNLLNFVCKILLLSQDFNSLNLMGHSFIT